jgi:hypothetical protein
VFLAADAQPVFDISEPIDEEALLLVGHPALNHHQIYAFEDGLEGNPHLLQRTIQLLETVLHAIVQQNIHNVAKVLRTWVAGKIVDSLSFNHSVLVHHR